ncbi:MAG TPA: hypothetical protein VGS19_01420 [Streptosporangiaceae bacterium]|nr:hypothetical protein [Streptosporangiaceae bacterium]
MIGGERDEKGSQQWLPRVAVVGAAALLAAGLAACGGGHHSSVSAQAWPGAVTTGSPQVPGDPAAPADTAVYTQRGSNSRVGWNYHETTLNTHDVTPSGFGRVASFPVKGKIYSQPLYAPGLRVGGVTRNVVIVTTEDDQVYAFDADATGSQPALLWHTNFLVHGATAVDDARTLHCGDYILPTVGITGTPVIDPATGRMYLITVMSEGSRVVDAMHAISITTGHDVIKPVVLRASVPGRGMGSSHGRVPFDPLTADQHAGLLLDNGVVYAAFSGYCDRPPNHGWILGYLASDLHQAVAYNDTPDGASGGIWQAATALVADSSGTMFVTTSNGPFNLATGGTSASDSLLELRRSGSTLKVVDYFTPYYQKCMEDEDGDFSSSAALLVGNNEIISTNKTGALYVLDRSHLGGYHTIPHLNCLHLTDPSADHIIQETPQGTINGGVWGMQTYFTATTGQYLYTAGVASRIQAWRLANGKIVLPATAHSPERLSYPGSIPVGSSDGASPGTAIVWALTKTSHPTLRAFTATDLSHELWNSDEGAAANQVPSCDNFILPTIANGRVYLGTSGELLVYGLLH